MSAHHNRLRALSLSLVFLLFCSTAAARDGYVYGFANSNPGAAFGRTSISSGEVEVLNPGVAEFVTVRRGIAAIDLQRGYYTWYNDEGLAQIDLADGSFLRTFELEDNLIEGLTYDPVTDRFYCILLAGGRIVSIHPETGKSELVVITSGLSGFANCGAFFDRQRGRYIFQSFGNGIFTYDVATRELVSNFLPQPGLLPMFNIEDGRLYMLTDSVVAGTALFGIDPEDGAESTPREVNINGAPDLVRCARGIHAAGKKLWFGHSAGMLVIDLDEPSQAVNHDISPVFFTGSVTYNRSPLTRPRIGGRLFADRNENCVRDTMEEYLSGFPIQLLPSKTIARSLSGGFFTMKFDQGEFDITPIAEFPWRVSCPTPPRRIVVDEMGLAEGDLEIGLVPEFDVELFAVDITSSRAQAGRAMTYHLSCYNAGTLPFSGVLHFGYDAVLENFSADPAADLVQPGLAEWNFENLPVGATVELTVRLMVPGREELRGTTICAKAEVEYADTGNESLDSRAESCTEILASFDPNDKAVAPAGVGPRGLISPEVRGLTYTLRFQNIGTAPARDVVIRDTLNTDLVLNVIRFGAATHEYSAAIEDDGVLEIRFDDIELPGKAQNEAASMGAINFHVFLQRGLENGVEIHNRAAIYFDFNAPVITNTVINTIDDEILAVPDDRSAPAEVLPIDLREVESGVFAARFAQSHRGQLRVYDITGALQFSVDVHDATQYLLDLRALPAGMYFVQLDHAAGRSAAHLLLRH